MGRYAFLCAFFAFAASAQQPLVHFHHLHFNSADPKAAIDFYSTRFNGEKAKFGGADAVWTGHSWFFFNKVNQPPPYEIVSSLYHLGWGAQDIKAEYQRLVQMGAGFELPLTDMTELLGGTPGRNFYAYVDGPDHAQIELNTTTHNDFQHIHLLGEDPVAAAAWYTKEFGIPQRGPANTETRSYKGVQISPFVFLNLDGVSLAWFPTGTARGLYPKQWQGRAKLASNAGRAIDHFAFSVDNLETTLARLRKDGVKILEPPRVIMGGKLKSAFVEGPDAIRIELVEGHPTKE